LGRLISTSKSTAAAAWIASKSGASGMDFHHPITSTLVAAM
jgi:hypothetical protein